LGQLSKIIVKKFQQTDKAEIKEIKQRPERSVFGWVDAEGNLVP
jgi:hypothetical protein